MKAHYWFCLLLVPACGTQVSDAYLGEPLLQMSGRVTLNGLTAADATTPALCFREELPDAPAVQLDHLPPVVLADFAGADFGVGTARAHIVDVETHGAFPTEFSVDVYLPPPAAALSAILPGEPRSANGRVCAVQAEHPAVVDELHDVAVSAADATATSTMYTDRFLRAVSDCSQFYSERYVCPTNHSTRENCEATQDGDPQLLAAGGGYVSVYGVDHNVEVLYLADPAPAGSYTAYLAGARDGLSAGYHVLSATVGLAPGAPDACFGGTRDAALAEVNAQLGTSFTDLPLPTDDTGTAYTAREIISAFDQVNARLEMAGCPIEYRARAQVASSALSIELNAEDPDWAARRPKQQSTP